MSRESVGKEKIFLRIRAEETSEWIEMFVAEGLVKSVIKDRRDELGDAKICFKELEEGRVIAKEDIRTVGKGFF